MNRMRFALFLLMPLALFSCDAESSRKLKQKVGSLGQEATQKAENALKSSKETSTEKPAPKQSVSPSSGSNPHAHPNSIHQALQQLEGQRRAQEQGFKDQIPSTGNKPTTTSKPKTSSGAKPGNSSTAKPNSSYQGFPGFEK